MGATAGGLDDAACRIGSALDQHLGAEFRRQPECGLGHVHGDDAGAQRGRDQHRRQPHAATAVDRDPLPGRTRPWAVRAR